MRIFAGIVMLANDLFFIALSAAIGGILAWAWGIGIGFGAMFGAIALAILILRDRVRSGRWWWNYFPG